MVKIDANNTIRGIANQNGVQTGKKTTAREFDRALQTALGSASTQKSEVESTHFLGNIRPAQFEKTNAAQEGRVVDQVDLRRFVARFAENVVHEVLKDRPVLVRPPLEIKLKRLANGQFFRSFIAHPDRDFSNVLGRIG